MQANLLQVARVSAEMRARLHRGVVADVLARRLACARDLEDCSVQLQEGCNSQGDNSTNSFSLRRFPCQSKHENVERRSVEQD